MKKTTFIKQLPLLISFFCAVSLGFGQIVAWKFVDPVKGDEPTSDATTFNTNLNTSTLSRGSGIEPSIFYRSFSSNDFWANGTKADAIANNEYLEFQVSATSGYQVSLSTLDATFRRSNTGPNEFIWQYSIDGVDFSDIGTTISYTTGEGEGTDQTQIDLSTISALQNVLYGTTITFRLYGWGASHLNGTFAIGRIGANTQHLSVGGIVSVASCSSTTTWNGVAWNPVLPDINTNAIIAADYNTLTNGSFSACNLTVNAGSGLRVSNGDYVEVENDVIADGGIIVETQANFVQNNDLATFTDNSGGLVLVSKEKIMQKWYSYTYWSSPTVSETIEGVLGNTPIDRRFKFVAANFIDVLAEEIGNTNVFVPGQDGLDDDGDDWKPANGSMVQGVGYAATTNEFGPTLPRLDKYDFYGEFNNGKIEVPLVSASAIYENWNLVGNPYPCAISADQLFLENPGLFDAIYLWDQGTPPSSSAGGSQNSNFSNDDYAIISGTGSVSGSRGDTGLPPLGFVPSGQGFFVDANFAGNLVFNNSMRAITNDNSQFFKNNTKTKVKITNLTNRLWINLTSDSGFFNQIMVGYINGATNANDGAFYDTKRALSSVNNTTLYSIIDDDNSKFAIQGKDVNSLDENEIIKLGFKSTINVATLFTLSAAQLEGDFLNSNTVYLKDNLLNKTHNLSASDYTFTSAVGEFNNRFEVAFSTQALAVDEVLLNKNSLRMVQLENDDVQFNTTTNLSIKTVRIYDMLGRQLYSFKGKTASEIYKLSNLNNSIFIAKVELSNGAVISKKAFKK